MLFNEFAEEIKYRVAEKMGKNFQIELIEREGANGVKELYLDVRHEKENVLRPVIRLHSLYDWFQAPQTSEDLEPIVKYAVKMFNGEIPEERQAREMCDNLFDFQWAREHIMFRLLHTKWNPELLNALPHIPFLDLSVVFYIELDKDGGKLSKVVDHTLANAWGVNEQELYAEALKNTPEKRMAYFKDFESVLLGELTDKETAALRNCEKEMGIPQLYLLTNKNRFHGAATLLYPGLLRQCAESLGSDLVILPSSVHEVILLRADDEAKQHPWADFITDVNHTDVAENDVLSDHPYLYLKEQDQVISFGISESQESAG